MVTPPVHPDRQTFGKKTRLFRALASLSDDAGPGEGLSGHTALSQHRIDAIPFFVLIEFGIPGRQLRVEDLQRIAAARPYEDEVLIAFVRDRGIKSGIQRADIGNSLRAL